MTKIETNVVKPEVSFFENEMTNLILSTESESNMDNKLQEIEDYDE